MMAAPAFEPTLLDRLPPVRGRLTANAPLHKVTWFAVGGPAEVLFKPEDADDLAAFLKNRPKDVPVTVIGVGSNLLVRDGGVPGVVVRLGRAFATIEVENAEVLCGGGALDGNVARAAANANVTGLEFLSGVPGTIGGAVRMNAGAYGGEMKDVLVSAKAIDGNGELHELTSNDLGFAYRRSTLQDDWIVVSAHLRGQAGQGEDILARMADIQNARGETQPVRTKTGGSTFKNPDGQKAWELIDRAGCRGLRVGGAQVSEKHCNFLINDGTATAADLEALGEEVRRRVRAETGVTLEWEIRRIGVALPTNDGENGGTP